MKYFFFTFFCFFCNATFFHSVYVIEPPQPSSAIYGGPPFTRHRCFVLLYSRDEHGSRLDQDWSQFWPDQDWIGLQFIWKLADQDWIRLRKFLFF